MPFLRNVPGLEAVFLDYAPKGVQFFYLYKTVTHPGTNGFVEPYTLAERLKHVAIARQRLGTAIPWICDSMSNDIKHALGGAPNGEFVIDAAGKIVRKRFWHDPAGLRTFLEALVGPVDVPTKVADLDMPLTLPERKVARGVVPPLRMTGRLIAIKARPVVPKDGGLPFFVKVIAEGSRDLIEDGSGKLYLGFNLDPIYSAHWNNRAGGLRYTITKPGDTGFEPLRGSTPEYEHDADIDPREFMFDFVAPKAGDTFLLTVDYTVCDDAEEFCLPVEQQYELTLTRDPDGGSRAGDWMTELVGDPLQYDTDGDGRASRAELPKERAGIILNHYDRDHDGFITPAEVDLVYDMIRIRKGETGR